MAVLTGQAKIDAQAKVTAIANGLVDKSQTLAGSGEYVANKAVPNPALTGKRLGGPSSTDIANSKSDLIGSQRAINQQIRQNNEFIATFDDPTKSWNDDPAIVSARQQVQTSTLALQSASAKIDEALATIDGASTQIQATAAPEITTTDTAQTSIINTSSPATVTAGTGNLPANQLSNLKKLAGSNTNLGTIPNVSNKTEPSAENSKSPLAAQGSLGGTPRVGPTSNPDSVDLNKVLPNVLHQYASYTYGLSLHLLSKDEYNKIVEKGEYTPTRVLISSAGRYNNTPGPTQFIRSPYFKEDFYFDNFSLETVIGLNAQSRNTNAIKYQFTLIEPYGFTLLDRIISLCNSPELECDNYLDMPYLLQIDFFGVDDSGQITGAIPNTTKRIPIKLLKMDAKISARGSEYMIEGSVYNHSAYDLTTVTTPANFEVEARTVAEFFQSNETTGDTTDISAQRESAQATAWTNTNGRIVGPDGQFTPVNTLNQSLLSIKTKRELGLIKSYGTALNNFQKAAYDDGKIGFSDKYFFDFLDPEIANSPFTTGAISSPKNSGMVAIDTQSGIAKDNTTKKGDLGFNTNAYRSDLRLFQINAGTYIDQVIAWVIRNSKWMTDQIVIPDGVEDVNKYLSDLKETETKPLYWFKIVPSIKLINFDKIRKVWAREITYHIQKYEVRNLKINVGPGGTAGQSTNPKPPVKSYNYIYTGKNDDILDLDIQFNTSYYTALTLYRTSPSKITQLATASESLKDANPKTNNIGVVQDPNAIMPMVMKPQILDARTTTGSGALTTKQIAVADLESSLLTLSQADMLHVKLKIIGDPSLIKQDDVFWTPKSNAQVSENKTNADPRLTPDGSLKMDGGEVYVNLTFRTPVDIDETTGLMQFKNQNILGPTQVSLFSGLFRIMTVTNEFRSGMFTQVLNLIRLPKQAKLDYATNKSPTSDNRNILLGQTAQMDDYMQGPNFNTPDAPKRVTVESDETSRSAQQQLAGPNNVAPEVRSSDQNDLVETRALAPEEPISETNLLTQVPPGPTSASPTAAAPGAVFDGISASDLQYIRSQSAALGLNPSALNGYLTNRLQDYPPNLRAKVAADVVKLKEILRKRNQ